MMFPHSDFVGEKAMEQVADWNFSFKIIYNVQNSTSSLIQLFVNFHLTENLPN